MRALGAILLLLLLVLDAKVSAAPSPESQRLVLIVGASSPVRQLDSSAVQKLFLGMTVEQDGVRLRPLLNESDSTIVEVFLQNVVAMTDSTYERRILRLAMQGDAFLPKAYTNTSRLLAAVTADPTAVSVAWESDVAQNKGIRVLRVLWHN